MREIQEEKKNAHNFPRLRYFRSLSMHFPLEKTHTDMIFSLFFFLFILDNIIWWWVRSSFFSIFIFLSYCHTYFDCIFHSFLFAPTNVYGIQCWNSCMYFMELPFFLLSIWFIHNHACCTCCTCLNVVATTVVFSFKWNIFSFFFCVFCWFLLFCKQPFLYIHSDTVTGTNMHNTMCDEKLFPKRNNKITMKKKKKCKW